MAKKDLTKKATTVVNAGTTAPDTTISTPVINAESTTPADEEGPKVPTDAPLVVAPRDLAEAQDMAEAKGIDYVGRNLEQLTAALNAGSTPPATTKKLVKVKKEIEVPANVDPAIKAAIDKANAEIAIAKQKVSDAKELAAKQKAETKAKAEAEKADRVAKIQADREAAAKIAEEAAKALEEKKAEATAKLTEAEAHLERLKGQAELANNAVKVAQDAVNGFKAILGQKVPGVKTTRAAGTGAKVADMTKYEIGKTYTVNNKGVMVEATCVRVNGDGIKAKKFYRFKETATGNVFHFRAYAED